MQSCVSNILLIPKHTHSDAHTHTHMHISTVQDIDKKSVFPLSFLTLFHTSVILAINGGKRKYRLSLELHDLSRNIIEIANQVSTSWTCWNCASSTQNPRTSSRTLCS